ncbi:hypothetical protein BJX65DRAFT_306883 [Aspergillus insuetus]
MAPQSYYSPSEAGRPSGGGYAETIISESGSYAPSHASRSSRASHPSHASRSQSQYSYPHSGAGSYVPSHASSRSHAPSHAGTMRTHGSDMRRSAMSTAHSQSHYGSEMQRYDDHQQYNGGEPFCGSLYQRDMADRAYLESERVANSMICAGRRAREEAYRNDPSVRQYTDEEYVAMKNQARAGGGCDDGRSIASRYTQGSRRGGSQYAGSQYGGYDDDDRTIVPDDSHSVAGSRGSYHSRR